ncbi:S8 family serine peptidase [Pedobacter antarcticus]|uniref:S8 family serine peptidase n=1 Tax=Pedobacter antarcticus TaxID=34086 RepID=UPI0029304F57|nr:S8 family serine peptidase [Pedobacter antarcticus]
MTLRTSLLLLFVLFFSSSFFACKKSETLPSVNITIDSSVIHLKNDEAYRSCRVYVSIQNLQPGESDEVIWSSENPRVARVSQDGLISPEGAGETYVLATMVSGKGIAKCKVIVTDANDYKFRLVLKDKGNSNFSFNRPEAYLSLKAIERRRKMNISIDATDLPISEEYLDAIRKVGGTIVAKSKWLNTVSINCSDKFLIDKYKTLPFVKDVIMVWEGKRMTSPPNQKYTDIAQVTANHTNNVNFDYGSASDNIRMNNGQVLHQQGFKGAGIDIAVIDAGFISLKSNPAFKNVNIKGAKSFIYEDDNPYAVDDHGIFVTSCMAINLPGTYVGTAPEANYWLFRTEDRSSEAPIEEDYWVNAAEYADSVGVDIINSSLTYSNYGSFSDMNKIEDLDGKTAFATRGANAAVSKGIFLVNCAGNDNTYVGTPADSPGVLTVGSVNSSRNMDRFNSWGFTADGRIKPDVMAKGGGASVINVLGNSEKLNGTSFASPIICGLVACLWQAYPRLTNKELLEVIKKSADRASNPVLPYGYGIPDMQIAMDMSKAITISR